MSIVLLLLSLLCFVLRIKLIYYSAGLASRRIGFDSVFFRIIGYPIINMLCFVYSFRSHVHAEYCATGAITSKIKHAIKLETSRATCTTVAALISILF